MKKNTINLINTKISGIKISILHFFKYIKFLEFINNSNNNKLPKIDTNFNGYITSIGKLIISWEDERYDTIVTIILEHNRLEFGYYRNALSIFGRNSKQPQNKQILYRGTGNDIDYPSLFKLMKDNLIFDLPQELNVDLFKL